MMNDEDLLYQLEELVGNLAISVRDKKIHNAEVQQRWPLPYWRPIHSFAECHFFRERKNQVIIKARKQFDLSDIYLKPVIR